MKPEITDEIGRIIRGIRVFKINDPPWMIDRAPKLSAALGRLHRNNPPTIWVRILIPSRSNMFPPVPKRTTTKNQ